MFQSAPSPNRNAPHSAAYGFATPVRTPSTSYSAYSQALTPAADASAKAVRFQNQPLPPQQLSLQQQQQSQVRASASTPNKSPYHNAVSAQSQPAQAQPAQPRASGVPASAPKMVAPSTAAVGESSIALKRRLKWNLGALGLLWIVPALTSKPRDLYWLVLDQIYLHIGGETDELVDGVVGWTMWAISVVLIFNAVEAAVGVRRSNTVPEAPQSAGSKAGGVLGIHSPQVTKSINFVAASRLKGSPKTRTSSIGAGSPISRSPGQRASPTGSPGSATVTDYSQFSPSVRRSSNPVPSPSQGGFGSASRMGTPTPGNGEYASVGAAAAASSSPLAAFKARHASRASSSSPSSLRASSVTRAVSGGVDLSFDDDGGEGEGTFLGDESFEVDRALRSLRSSMGVSSTPAPFR